jgi:DNA-binding GntR family transcriptional regulator
MHGLSERVSPLTRETLEDGVYRQLCEVILHGGIAPGESITVASLADAFGVSPMPVRKALARLSAGGALTVLSGRSIGVPKLMRSRLDELKRVRLVIETAAAGWAAERASDAFVAHLDKSYRALLDSERAGDAKGYVQANYDFHFDIYRQSESQIMLQIIESLWLQISPYFHLLRSSGNFRISNRHHGEIFEAMKTRDTVRAQEALCRDINDAYAVLVELVV